MIINLKDEIEKIINRKLWEIKQDMETRPAFSENPIPYTLMGGDGVEEIRDWNKDYRKVNI